jgi:hypothetical protein
MGAYDYLDTSNSNDFPLGKILREEGEDNHMARNAVGTDETRNPFAAVAIVEQYEEVPSQVGPSGACGGPVDGEVRQDAGDREASDASA